MIRSYRWIVFVTKAWQLTRLLLSFFFLVWRAVWGIQFVRRRKSMIWEVLFPTGLVVSYRICKCR
jgi:hypothetical protein